jgi:hypothetical protein
VPVPVGGALVIVGATDGALTTIDMGGDVFTAPK